MRVKNEHWAYFISFAEEHPELVTNKFTGATGRASLNNLWQHITDGLNSLGFGEKTVDEWRKAIVDWKSKTKAKATQIKTEVAKTGGGPNCHKVLTDLEERLLNIMGRKALEGDVGVEELGFGPVQIKVTDSVFEPEKEILPTTSVDHTYMKRNIDVLSKKHKLTGSNSTIPKRKKNILSQRLVDMNKDTLNVLSSINDNMTMMSESFQDINKTLAELKQFFFSIYSNSA